VTARESYWPAYLPYGPDTPVPYGLTRAAEAVLAAAAAEPGIDAELEADAYVTEVWCPLADNGIQRLYSPMKADPEPEAGL
jgi:hypothetical protein